MKTIIISSVLLCSLIAGLSYSFYLHKLQDAYLWWSNLSDQEKLVFFRTENALYYSYYDEFINQPTIKDGFNILINNNLTESPSSINVINRMNILPEIVLGLLFKLFECLGVFFNPINFYINCVYLLQSISIISCILLACSISSSLLSGLVCAFLFLINRHSISRSVDFVALRENFALPFWWLHLLTWHLMMRPKKPRQHVYFLIKSLFLTSTLLFSLTWQFSQFIFLQESIVIFVMYLLEQIPSQMNKFYNQSILGTLLLTSLLQFGNLMVLTSFTLSFIVSCMIMSCFKAPKLMHSSFSGRLTWLSIQATSRFCIAILLRAIMKFIIPHEDDSHIMGFILAKFGIGDRRDFSVNLYMCNNAFNWMSIDDYLDKLSYVGYPYLIVYSCLSMVVLIAALSVLWHDTDEEEELQPGIRNNIVGGEGDFCIGCSHLLGNRPELFYHYGLSTLFLFTTLIVARMQYLSTPYLIVMSCMASCDWSSYKFIYKNIASLLRYFTNRRSRYRNNSSTTLYTSDDVRTSSSHNFKSNPHSITDISVTNILDTIRICVILSTIINIGYQASQDIQNELNHLGQFYDPDTIELMDWINYTTQPTDIFAGSMQLMAAVKLVTKRPIANHPHFENANLRLKTKQIYQVYSRMSDQYIYNTLKSYKINYIIIENSICYQKRSSYTINDIVDIGNGHLPNHHGYDYYYYYDLRKPLLPRFCDSIQYNNDTSQFKNLFSNPTFRVYQLIE